VLHDTSVKLDKEIDKVLQSSFASREAAKIHLSKTVKFHSPNKESPPRSVLKKEPSEYQKRIVEKYNQMTETEKRMIEQDDINELKPIQTHIVKPIIKKPVERNAGTKIVTLDQEIPKD
jgi:predicted ATP-grasp superfamily ATP-dependent carboligase